MKLTTVEEMRNIDKRAIEEVGIPEIVLMENASREIAKAMDAYREGMTKEEAAEAACKAVRDLAIEVGIPQHLTEIGIKEEDIPALAEQAITDVCTPGNPREVTKEDIIALYKKVL